MPIGAEVCDRALDFTQRLVRIPSETTDPDVRIYDEIENEMKLYGFRVERIYDEGCEQFQNIVGIYESPDFDAATGKTIAFFAHSDQKPVGDEKKWSHGPYAGEVDAEGRGHGRGWTDCKSSIAAEVTGIGKFINDNPNGNYRVLVVAWPGEELGGHVDVNGEQRTVGYTVALEKLVNKLGETDKPFKLDYAVNADAGYYETEDQVPGVEGAENGVYFFELTIGNFNKIRMSETNGQRAMAMIRAFNNFEFEAYKNLPDSKKPSINVGRVDYGLSSAVEVKGANQTPSVTRIRFTDAASYGQMLETIAQQRITLEDYDGFKGDEEKLAITVYARDSYHGSTPFLITDSTRNIIRLMDEAGVTDDKVHNIYAGTEDRSYKMDFAPDFIRLGVDTRLPLGMDPQDMISALRGLVGDTLGGNATIPDSFKPTVPETYWTAVKFDTESVFSRLCLAAIEEAMGKTPDIIDMRGATLFKQTMIKYVEPENIVGLAINPAEQMHTIGENGKAEDVHTATKTTYGIMEKLFAAA